MTLYDLLWVTNSKFVILFTFSSSPHCKSSEIQYNLQYMSAYVIITYDIQGALCNNVHVYFKIIFYWHSRLGIGL